MRPDKYSPDCAKRYLAYRAEMMAWSHVKMCNNYLIVALRPSTCPTPPPTKP